MTHSHKLRRKPRDLVEEGDNNSITSNLDNKITTNIKIAIIIMDGELPVITIMNGESVMTMDGELTIIITTDGERLMLTITDGEGVMTMDGEATPITPIITITICGEMIS